MIQTFFTFANASTLQGIERIFTTVKLFRQFFSHAQLEELNMTLAFYCHQITSKPNARYIVLMIDEHTHGFGFGIFTDKEVAAGKAICKKQNFLHEYMPIDAFHLKIIEHLKEHDATILYRLRN